MKKVICLVLVILATVAIARVEADGHKPCGKYSADWMLKYVHRYCDKPAKYYKAPVTSKCCEPFSYISEKCFYSYVYSDTWKHSGYNPKIVITIPKRCRDHH